MRQALAMLLLCVIGCGGGDGSTCQTAACPGGQSYSTCATPGSAAVEYRFGGERCACTGADCTSCAARVAQFCGGVGGVVGLGDAGLVASGDGGIVFLGSHDMAVGGGGFGGSGGGGSGGGGGGAGGSGGGGSAGSGGGGMCAPNGATCAAYTDCCSLTCARQQCSGCYIDGSRCTSANDCCNGACTQGVCRPACTGMGGQCTLAGDCCSGICAQGFCRTCSPTGSACSSTGECCSGLSCTNGYCLSPTTSCASLRTPNACAACCQGENAAGFATFLADEKTCACSTCAASCSASLCGGNGIDAACMSCVTTMCMPALQRCAADPGCSAYLNCGISCSKL